MLPPRVAQFRVDLWLIAGRIKRFVGELWSVRLVRAIARFALGTSELLFISAVMQMGLALPMAYYFHRATTIGLPANVVVVPLTELMMPAAIAAIGLGYVSGLLAKIPIVLLVSPQGRILLIDAGGPSGPGGSQLDFGEDVVTGGTSRQQQCHNS